MVQQNMDKLADLIAKNTDITTAAKQEMLALCKDVSTNFSELEQFEMRYPRLVAWVDLISRTLSRLGV